MAEKEIARRVRDDDPERCASNNSFGQCYLARVEGSLYCHSHGGAMATKTLNAAEQRSYKLTKWKGRVNDFTTSPSIKTLREEIGIARMTLEQILERCEDATEILINSNRISQMLERIEKLVVSCDRLETKMAFTLDKSAAFLLADQIINILTEEIDDLDLIEKIADKIGSTLTMEKKYEL